MGDDNHDGCLLSVCYPLGSSLVVYSLNKYEGRGLGYEHVFVSVSLTTMDKVFQSLFIDKEIGVQRDLITYPQSHSK